MARLEKEAVMKGIPLGQAHDIEIPPPRPKRKPSSPYPRKTGLGSLSPSGEVTDEKTSKSFSPLSPCKQAIDMETDASWKIHGAKENSDDGSCSEVLNLFQDAPSISISSANKGSSNSCMYREFVPVAKEKIALNGSSLCIEMNKELKGNDMTNADCDTGKLEGICSSPQTNFVQDDRTDVPKQPEKLDLPLDGNIQCEQSHPKQTHVHFIQSISSQGNIPSPVTSRGAHVNNSPFISPTVTASKEVRTNSGMSSIHQSYPPILPFTQFQSNLGDAYRSFHNIPSNFASLLVSTLLQNPAVHAVATLAASFWPSADMDTSTDSTSESVLGGIPGSQMNSSPSMAAIAAATVAAASAWWATQGLLPFFPPLQSGYAFAPAATTTAPTNDTAQAPEDRNEVKSDTVQNTGLNQQVVNPEQCDALKLQCPSSKSMLSSLSDSDEGAGGELKSSKPEKFKPPSVSGFHESEKARSNKQLDRSSCGSNTASSSEVETDAIDEKQGEVKDEANQDRSNNPSAETSTRRVRSSGSINESWKEVSEEGRLAFQALFTREKLPQSFSPLHNKDAIVNMDQDKEAATMLPVDLNRKAYATETTDLHHVQGYLKEQSARSFDTTKDSLTSDIGHGKLKARRTGFKPYKRCSVEAKENRAVPGEENGNKRIRLEGETST